MRNTVSASGRLGADLHGSDATGVDELPVDDDAVRDTGTGSAATNASTSSSTCARTSVNERPALRHDGIDLGRRVLELPRGGRSPGRSATCPGTPGRCSRPRSRRASCLCTWMPGRIDVQERLELRARLQVGRLQRGDRRRQVRTTFPRYTRFCVSVDMCFTTSHAASACSAPPARR